MSHNRIETSVSRDLTTPIPASIRRQHDIRPGDKLVWTTDGERIVVEVKRKRPGAFADFEPFDLGEETDATADHDEPG